MSNLYSLRFDVTGVRGIDCCTKALVGVKTADNATSRLRNAASVAGFLRERPSRSDAESNTVSRFETLV